jgi:hypothetical protein
MPLSLIFFRTETGRFEDLCIKDGLSAESRLEAIAELQKAVATLHLENECTINLIGRISKYHENTNRYYRFRIDQHFRAQGSDVFMRNLLHYKNAYLGGIKNYLAQSTLPINRIEPAQQQLRRIENELCVDDLMFHLNRGFLHFLHWEIKRVSRDLALITQDLWVQRQSALFRSHQLFILSNLLNREYNKQLLFNVQNAAYQQAWANLHPIIIQDIIVTHTLESDEVGETETAYVDDNYDYLERLIQKIQSLANFAFMQHKKNCDDSGQLIGSSANHITRIITDEFSFYPNEPLAIESYTVLLRAIYSIAQKLPLNLHLILASFPVLDKHQRLHNITVHVTCGNQPLLHHHSKAFFSSIDWSYSGKKFATEKAFKSKVYMAPIYFGKRLCFSSGTLLSSSTAGGTQFISNIEVCVEHHYEKGSRCLSRNLNLKERAQQIIPLQYSHIVTSNSVDLNTTNVEPARITQADRVNPGVWVSDPLTGGFSTRHPSQLWKLYSFFGQRSNAYVFEPLPASFLPSRFFQQAARSNTRVLRSQSVDPIREIQEQSLLGALDSR